MWNHRKILASTFHFHVFKYIFMLFKCKQLNLVTVLTWEEYEELQWVWKQQWRPAGFVPEPTGRRPLGRPLGLHCSVEVRTERETEWNRGTVRGQQATGWTGGLHGSHHRGNLSFSYRGEGLKCETKWSPKYSCSISKVHNPTPPHSSQVSVEGKRSADSS